MDGISPRPAGTPRQLAAALAYLLLSCPALQGQTPSPEAEPARAPYLPTWGALGRSSPDGPSILLANLGLRGPVGHSLWLDPLRDLVIRVQPGDRCEVTVLDALPPHHGALSPRRFPCAFGPRQVRYTQLGPPQSRTRAGEAAAALRRRDFHGPAALHARGGRGLPPAEAGDPQPAFGGGGAARLEPRH